MYKKILMFLLVIITIFTLTSCTTKKEESVKKKETKKVEEKLEINGYDLTLNKTSSFENLKFKYPEDTTINSYGTYIVLEKNKLDSEEQLFQISIAKFGYKDDEEVITNGTKKEDKKFNSNEWLLYDVSGNNTYVHQDGHDVYTITFIYNEDLSSFENEFMKKTSFIE